MWDTILEPLGLLIAILLGAIIITSIGRKKSECPLCGKKAFTKKALVVDQTTGVEMEGDIDFEYTFVIAMSGLLIGAVLWAVALSAVLPNLVNEYAVSTRVENAIEPLFELFSLLFAGLACIWYSLPRTRRAIATRGKTMTCQFECRSRKHTWTEAVAARA